MAELRKGLKKTNFSRQNGDCTETRDWGRERDN